MSCVYFLYAGGKVVSGLLLNVFCFYMGTDLFFAGVVVGCLRSAPSFVVTFDILFCTMT